MTRGRIRTSGRQLKTWAASLAATAVSTYALDAFAAVAGVALVASGLLDGAGHQWLLGILVASYALWAFGLRANLRANWTLLAATGTSTNVLSKAGYDLARRTTSSTRAPRLAAAAGYTCTEVAKEVPYYTASFGAAVVSDSISANEALIFLSGANLAAALYEFGIARLTSAFLRYRRRGYASFDTDWIPADYLTHYYSTIEADEVATIAFLVQTMQHVQRDQPVLFFGVGPTLHHVFAVAELASEIHLGDYLPANLAEIQRWLERAPGAHDWRPFIRYTLQCEGNGHPTDRDVTVRENLARDKITRLLRVDGRHSRPVNRLYATVISPYCADSATDDRSTWELLMRNITGLVRPGGVFITAALRRCRGYTVAGKAFPSANVDEHDLRALLRPAFDQQRGSTEVHQTAQTASHGYTGIVLCWATRRGARIG